MSKTVKQIADELGVSKQAVHQKRKAKALATALQPFTTTVDGVVYISEEGEKLLKEAFSGADRKAVDGNKFTPVDGQVDAPEHPLYAILKAELDAKNQQIAELQDELAKERQHSREQAEKLAQLADQAQRLHAGSMQQQLLPEAGAVEDAATVEPAPEPSEPVKKKGLFGWLRKKEDKA